MTSVQVGIGHESIPVIDPATWPLRIQLDNHTSLCVYAKDRGEVTIWLRKFAADLLSHANAVEADRAQGLADLEASRAELANIQHERSLHPDYREEWRV